MNGGPCFFEQTGSSGAYFRNGIHNNYARGEKVSDRNTDLTRSFVCVDLNEEFPFLITKISSYYDPEPEKH